jgi:hypothetical protein
LEIITIYSHDEDIGIDYYYNRGDETELLNLRENNPLTMKDLPGYKYNQLMKTKLTSNVQLLDRTGFDLDLIYQVVDRGTIYNILIRILIIVVVLFFITLFMIFLVSKKDNVSKSVKKEKDEDEEMSLDWNESGFDDDETDELDIPPLKDENSDFDDLNFDSEPDDFGSLNLEDASDDFGDLELKETDGDFSDISFEDSDDDIDNFSIDEPEDDLENISFDDDTDTSFDDLNLDGDIDMDIESDFPEEEDLLAMDHETSPANDFDDLDMDDVSDYPNSGINWEDFIEEKLNHELENASSLDQDLVIGIIKCESLTDDNNDLFAEQLKEDLNNSDILFEYKENNIAVIIPDANLDDALHIFETFTAKEEEEYGEINIGISSRNNRKISGSRIFMEAENALHKAFEDSDKNIVGFRSDPEKFREFLAKKQ